MSAPTHAPTGLPLPQAADAVWCCEYELCGSAGLIGLRPPAPSITAARVLVRLHSVPMGYLTVPLTAEQAALVSGRRPADHDRLVRITEAIWVQCGQRIREHLSADDATLWRLVDPVDANVEVSVVVCTRNRGPALAGCLRRLAAISYRMVEFVVVDNAPADDTTRRIVASFTEADPRFRYLLEPVAGLSRARNCGLLASTGAVIAYTDDDVSVDPGWVHGLIRGFRQRADVGCVTGLVATAEITTAAEAYFDARTSSWSTRCGPQLFEASGGDGLYPYSAGLFGTGANVAFDRALLVGLGGFDEALGAGTLSRGGEDLDIFVRILQAGRTLAYEPAALVWHHHRTDDRALLRQMYGYGSGLTAYLTKLLCHRGTRGELLRRVPHGLVRLVSIARETRNRLGPSVRAPRGALLREYLGFLAGPVLYLRARLRLRTGLPLRARLRLHTWPAGRGRATGTVTR